MAYVYTQNGTSDITSGAAAGRVGIGVASPSSQLHVSGGTGSCEVVIEADTDNSGEADQPSLTFKQDGGVVQGKLGYFNSENELTLKNVYAGSLHLGTNDTKRLTIESDGDVGIGTTSPNNLLHIKNGDLMIENDAATGGTGIARLHFAESNQSEGQMRLEYDGDNQGGDANMLSIVSDKNDKEVLTVTYGEKVGIGTTSPSVTLDVVQGTGSVPTLQPGTVGLFRNNAASGDTGRITLLGGATGWSGIDLGDSDDSDIGGIFYNHTSNYMTFKTNNTLDGIVLASNTNVGIGITNPGAKLEINPPASGSSLTVNMLDNQSIGMEIKQGSNNYVKIVTTNSSEKIILGNTTTNPKVGIGEASPDTALDVRGDFVVDGDTDANPGVLIKSKSITKGGYLTLANNKTFSDINDGDVLSYIRSGGGTINDPSTAVGGEMYIKHVADGDWSTGAPANDQGKLHFGHTGTDLLTIESGGNAGIGTASPSTKLDVNGPIAMKTYSDATRPSASSLATGTMIYNTSDNAPNFTDGTNWRDAMGNIT